MWNPEEIPLSARIFAAVDVWDALGSDRPYRAGWPPGEVRAHLLSLSGTHLDPAVVAAFVRELDALEGPGPTADIGWDGLSVPQLLDRRETVGPVTSAG